MNKFSKDFIFATSTNAFQIEGARYEGGRSASIWDEFTEKNYYIPPAGSNAREINSIKIAADFYHKYQHDIKIMKQLGINGFVYNLDWSRIVSAHNKINSEGLKWTIALFEELSKNQIKPIPIIYHWDTPVWLEKMGGVTGQEFLKSFRFFVKTLFKHLGKYSDIWYVNDENSSFTISGYAQNYFPPGKSSKKEMFEALHQLNLSAAVAKEEFLIAKSKQHIAPDALLGIDHDWSPGIPFDKNNSQDKMAVQKFNAYNLKMYLDPNLLGKYPAVFYEELTKLGLEKMITKSDLDYLKKYTLDLIGWNYYRPTYVTTERRIKNQNILWQKKPEQYFDDILICYPKSVKYTAWNWVINPHMIVPGAKMLEQRYHKPIMIIENGIGAFEDDTKDHFVKDGYRINYLNDHLQEVQKAVSLGINFIGYSLWTYCDIFSPSGGYRKKYGIVKVDFNSHELERYPKASFYWYQEVIAKRTTFDFNNTKIEKYYKK